MTAKRAHDQAFPEDKDAGQHEEVLPPGESHWDWLPLLIRDYLILEGAGRTPTTHARLAQRNRDTVPLQTETPPPPHPLEPMARVDAQRRSSLFRRLPPELRSHVTHPCCFLLAQPPLIGTGCPPWSKTWSFFGRGWPNTGKT